MRRRSIVALVAVPLLAAAVSLHLRGADARPAPQAIEAWADPSLRVTAGLTLWLDAARLNAARQAGGLSPLADGAAVESWYDGSGGRWHASQPDAAARPTYRDAGGFRTLRFDGERSYLTRG